MFHPGQQIGSYTLIRKLGRGGFGEVWLAEKRSEFVTTFFALKFPHREQVDFETIKHEAGLWAQANGHPNVLPIIEANIYEGQIAIISEFASDGSLEQLLSDPTKQLSQAESVEMIVGILRGLEFLHSRNIIHRDIKPANILLQGETPRLTDFGISRVMKGTSLSVTIAGTPKFMAPEAFDGKRNAQTDVWSVGVMLYLMLKGHLPFPQEETTELLGAIVFKEPDPLPASVPQNLQNIVKKALAKNPAERYQTAKEMREDLQKALVSLNHPTQAPTEISKIPVIPFKEPENLTPPTNLPTSENRPENFEARDTLTDLFVFGTDKKSATATEIKPLQTREESIEPTLRVAQPLATQLPAGRKRNPLYFILPGSLVVLVMIVGGYFLLNSNYIRQSTLSPIESSQLIPFRKGNKWGYSDAQKRIYITPQFEYRAMPFSEDLALVGSGDSKSGYIDKTGQVVIPLNLEALYSESFKEGLAKVKVGEKYGFIDKSGNIVIQPKYYSAESFSEGLAVVCLEETNNKVKIYPDCGFVDKSGSEVIPLKYFNVSSFSEGLAVVNDKTTAQKVINSQGTYYIGGKAIFLDKSGNVILSHSDSESAQFFAPFSEGLSAVPGTGSHWARYIDKSGKVIIQTEYSKARLFSEGLAGVGKYVGNKEKYGFIDRTGALVIPLQYDSVGVFSEGLAAVESNGKIGFVDKTGKVVIPLKYEGYIPLLKFRNGIVKVKLGDIDFYIGKDGTEYYEP